MTGTEFQVHGPHDHKLEHAAHVAHEDPFSGRIAVTTAVLATVAALFSYQAGATQASAILHLNKAAMLKTDAANQWDHYQITSNRQHVAELGAMLVGPEKSTLFRAEADRYRQEMKTARAEAERLEAEAKTFDERSEAELHRHHRWSQAMTALQVSIAMAAILLLTRRGWLHYAMYGLAGVGAVLGGLALLHV